MTERRFDPKIVSSSLEAHLKDPHVSLDGHVRRRIIENGEALSGRKSIYLDVRFWIHLREAAREPDASAWPELLDHLRRAVHSGCAFCPVTDSTFLEIFKQTDSDSRALTAQLVDELSLGVCMITEDLRVGTEIAHYVHSARGSQHLHPLEHLVWSKVSYALGFVHPVNPNFAADHALALAKAFFDHMWTDVSLSRIERLVGSAERMRDPLELSRVAETLNDGIRNHSNGLKSFRQAYEEELIGVLDLYADRVESALAKSVPPWVGPPPAPGTPAADAVRRHCLSFLVAALKTEAGRHAIRTLHIMTCLYASVRWNKGQKLKANDLFDFHHAAAAVGYCDAFFTEGPLRSMLIRSDLALDRQFCCFVTADVVDAVAYVKAI